MKTNFFEIILDRAEVLYQNPTFGEVSIRVKKVNRTRALIGYIALKNPLGNDFNAEYKTLKKQGKKLSKTTFLGRFRGYT